MYLPVVYSSCIMTENALPCIVFVVYILALVIHDMRKSLFITKLLKYFPLKSKKKVSHH